MTSRHTANQLVADDLLDVTGATITGLSHTSLNDIGSNTHPQLDGHVGSTLNPHAVTKAQVGLGNVPDVDCTDASNITTGTLDENRLPSSVATKLENVITVALSGGDYTSIQTAVNNADANDIIEVAPATYTENVSISSAVALRGGGGCRVTISGKVTVSVSSGNSVSLTGLGIEATNTECIEMTGTGTLRVSKCRLEGTWTSGAGQTTNTSKSAVKITAGAVSIGDSTNIVIDAAGDDTAEHNTSAYWLAGSSAVRLESFSCEHDIANTTDINQNLEVMFCNNTNSSSFAMIKNGWCTLTGVTDPLNYAAPFYMFNSNADARIDGNVIMIDSTGQCYTSFHSNSSSVTFFTNNVIFPTNVTTEYLAYESGTGSIHCATNVWNSATMPSVFGDVDHITSLADGTTVSSGSNQSVGADAGSERVTNVATPTASHDAVTKLYADTLPQPQPDRTFLVATSGGTHTSVAAALASVNALSPAPSTSNPATILVGPGVFSEANPLTIPSGVCVRGQAGFPTSHITAQTATSPIFEMESDTFLAYLWLEGADGTGGCGVRFKPGALFPMCQLVRVSDVTTGFYVEGPGTLALSTQICGTRLSASDRLDTFTKVDGGAEFVVCTARVVSGSPLIPLGIGVHVTGAGSRANINDVQIRNVQTAYLCENGTSGNRAVTKISSSVIRNTTVTALEVGAYSDMHLLATDLESYSGDELSLTTSTSRFYGTGNRIRTDHIVQASGSFLSSLGVSTDPQYERSYAIGSGGFSVGTYDYPARTEMGGGGPHTRYMRIFTETAASVFTDRTAAALYDDGTTFPLFDGTAINNRLYVGSDDTSSNGSFPGFEIIDISTALVHGGSSSLTWEYWNGSAWTIVRIMAAKATPDYYPRAKIGAFTKTEDQHIRLGPRTGQATTSVNGVTGWWIRITIAGGALTTAGVANQIKLHANSSIIGADGFHQFTGSARPIGRLPWDVGLFEPANASPTNQDTFVSDNLNVGRRENEFTSGTIDRVGMNTFLPLDCDTSQPITFRWAWYRQTSSTGNIDWRVRYGYTFVGTGTQSAVYDDTPSAPTTGPNEQQITLSESTPATNRMLVSTVTFYVEDMVARPEGTDPEYVFWLTLQRDNDGSSGNCVLVNVTAEYTKWCTGGYAG